MRKPLISIIIPTKDSDATIRKCLESILNQTYANIELIVVDSYSRDETRKIAENYGAAVFETDAERSQARNIGARKSLGDFVFFIDSDMQLDSSVVAECVKKTREGNKAVIVPEVSVGEGFWAKCKALEKSCYVGDDSIEAARFFEKNAFEKIGGYDPDLEAGEDWELNQRVLHARCKVGRVRSTILHDEGKLSLKKTIMKKYYYGKMLKPYMTKHPRDVKPQLGPARLVFLKRWKRLIADPTHAVGMLFMKTCEFGLGWIGYKNR